VCFYVCFFLVQEPLRLHKGGGRGGTVPP
jgi:hypothetical protein